MIVYHLDMDAIKHSNMGLVNGSGPYLGVGLVSFPDTMELPPQPCFLYW